MDTGIASISAVEMSHDSDIANYVPHIILCRLHGLSIYCMVPYTAGLILVVFPGIKIYTTCNSSVQIVREECILRAFDLAYYIYFASYFHVPADKWEEPDENNYYLPDDQIKEFLSIYLATLSDGISPEEQIMEEFNIHTAYVILRKLCYNFL